MLIEMAKLDWLNWNMVWLCFITESRLATKNLGQLNNLLLIVLMSNVSKAFSKPQMFNNTS